MSDLENPDEYGRIKRLPGHLELALIENEIDRTPERSITGMVDFLDWFGWGWSLETLWEGHCFDDQGKHVCPGSGYQATVTFFYPASDVEDWQDQGERAARSHLPHLALALALGEALLSVRKETGGWPRNEIFGLTWPESNRRMEETK